MKMEKKTLFWHSALNKIIIVCVVALLMLIPLHLIRNQVNDRSQNPDQLLFEMMHTWGAPQTFSGPWLSFSYREAEDKDKELTSSLYPDGLKYVVNTTTQNLHRSIYDVSVYTADMTIEGFYVLDDKIPSADKVELIFNMNDLKGIQGKPAFSLGGKALKIKPCAEGIKAEVALGKGAKEGDVVQFAVSMVVNGSQSIFFKPAANLTEVLMSSDYPDPSFSGDFLPVERELRPDGFTARWSVSQITLSSQSMDSFGVKMVKPVTQYRQTERATKYGLLIIFLVFIASFVVEIISKKPINIIQYMVIGASLVLFYSLLLAFSDFLSFGLAYLIASVMTTVALGAYFGAIVKNKWAFLLTGLVAFAYGVIYVLLQMETYAFLAGTLILFIILCVIMFLTKNLKMDAPNRPAEPN